MSCVTRLNVAVASLILILGVGGLRAVPGPDGSPAISAPTPRFSAARVDGDHLFLVDIVTTFVEVRTEVAVKEGGVVRPTVVTEYRPVFELRTSRYELREVKAYGADGKPLDARTVRDRLKDRAPVVVSADGREVDPFYLRAVKDGTVVLVLPPGFPRTADLAPEDIPPPRLVK